MDHTKQPAANCPQHAVASLRPYKSRALAPPPLLRGFRPRGPGGAPRTPGGNRGAPPRGVDVKPPRDRGPRRGPSPLEGPGGLPEASRRPGRAPWPARGSRGPGDRVRQAPRGGVLHQPLAPGPRGTGEARGGRKGPSGAREAKIPDFGEFGLKSPKMAIFGVCRDPPPGPPFREPRGGVWESAPPRRGGTPPEEGAGGLPLGRSRGRLRAPEA